MRDGSDRVELPYDAHACILLWVMDMHSLNCLGIEMKKVPGLGNGISHLPPVPFFFFFSTGNLLLTLCGCIFQMFTMLMENVKCANRRGQWFHSNRRDDHVFRGLGYMLVAYDSHYKHPCSQSKIFPHGKIKA